MTNEKVEQVHSGERAVVYHVDIQSGKFLVIGYTDADDNIEEYEVYWRNGLVAVPSYREEYAAAVEIVKD